MAITRHPLTPSELFQAFYTFYQDVIHRGLKITRNVTCHEALSFPDESYKARFATLTDDEVVAFCQHRPAENDESNVTGLWLVLWYDSEVNMNVFTPLCAKLLKLPAELFDQIDFNAAERSTKHHNVTAMEMIARFPLIIKRILSWPDDKLLTLCVDANITDPANENIKLTEGGLFILIASFCNEAFVPRDDSNVSTFLDAYQFLNNFIRFVSLFPAYNKDNDFERFIASSSLKFSMQLLCLINRLKYAAADSQTSSSTKLINEKFDDICTLETNLFNHFPQNLFYFTVITFMRTLLPPTIPQLPIEIKLLQKISPKCSAYENAHNIYQKTQYFLMNHFFTETHSTLPNKLNALKAAFSYGIKEWLCRRNRDTREIFRVAQAFLYANPANLNKNIRGLDLDMSEFAWLSEEIDKTLLNPPAIDDEEQVGKLIDHLFDQLCAQRSFIAPIYAKVEKLTAENTQMKSEFEILKVQMQELENKFDMLMRTVTVKAEVTAAKAEEEPKASPRLFGGGAASSGLQ